MEPATEAPAERTLVETVLMQEEMNLMELGRKPLPVLEAFWWFFMLHYYGACCGGGDGAREDELRRGRRTYPVSGDRRQTVAWVSGIGG